MSLTQIVAENIRLYRRRMGLTQEALGIKSKLHPDYIGRLERGVESISIPNLEKIAKALRIDAFLLLLKDSATNDKT